MERLTIEFRNAEDKSTLQRVIKALEMDVVLSDADEKSSVPESHYTKLKEISDNMDANPELELPWKEVKRRIISSNE